MTTVTTYLLITVVAIASFYFFLKFVLWLIAYRKWLNMFKVFPKDPAHPILGHLLDYPGPNEEGLKYQREQTKKYPRLVLAWMMQQPMIIVTHPETVKVILNSSEPKGEQVYNIIRPWIGDGLLTSHGRKWARNRRLLTPAFHFEILKNYIEVKNRCADILLQKFQKASDECLSQTVFTEVSMFTLDVILKCSMSYTTNCQEAGEVHPYVQAVNKISDLIVDRFFKPWFHPDILYFMTPNGRQMLKLSDYVHKVAEDIIQARKHKLEIAYIQGNKSFKCMDFLDILLTARDEEGKGLSDREIRDEVDTFLFEGHDTTSSAISWCLYSIAEHPAVQRKLQEELDEKFGGRQSQDVLWEDLADLPYLTKVIKESMRLHVPVPFILRKLTKDVECDGKVVPAGTDIMVLIYNIHHNPTVYDEHGGDTMKFDPERFSPENVKARDSYGFVPFSAGPRNCIGQTFAMNELKVVLARLLLKFSIKLDPTHKVEKDESIVMRAKNDIKILITARE